MIIVSTPSVVEESPIRAVVEPRLGMAVALVGSDGSTWDLVDGSVRLAAGASGFGAPTPEHWWRSAPSLDGSTWQGYRTPHRELTLPVNVHGSSSLDWRDTARAFFAAIEPSAEAQVVLISPDGRMRSLDVRFVDGGDPVSDIDPLLLRYQGYPLDFIAADPYWKGTPVVSTFTVDPGGTFFPGPPFYLESTHAIGSATVNNPGDVDAWPRWTVTGPFDQFTLGVGASVVSIDVTKVAGESVVIDMDPNRGTILDDAGADQWLSATAAEFAAIPAGSDVELTLDITGGGAGTSIELLFAPRYRLAL